jgi:cytochrome c
MKLRSVFLMMGFACSLLAPTAYADLATAQKGGCMGCHKVDAKLVGPAYKDVAAKYKGQKEAIAKLMERVRQGGPGNWGTVPMAASGPDKISDADLKKVIEWILAS